MKKRYFAGIDVGSTTVKLSVLDINNKLEYSTYRRHFSDIRSAVLDVLDDVLSTLGDQFVTMKVTGSAGMGVATWLELDFIQEVISCKNAVENLLSDVDVAIELGGEDAKITYFDGMLEQRMNGTCAGGTGAFIDQMASLLMVDTMQLDALAKNHTAIYPIASRCGVFAKSDIQPLLNEGASCENIAASIFQAVVNQTIGGLACGRPIKGKVVFLGGPLYYLPQLRQRFVKTLKLSPEQAIFPENAHLFVSIGAAFASASDKIHTFKELYRRMSEHTFNLDFERIRPLFLDNDEHVEFILRHSKNNAKRNILSKYNGDCFLGIDAGSTTTKAVLIDDTGAILHSCYMSNMGTPLNTTIKILSEIYRILPKGAQIVNSAVTGYGEHLVKAALGIDIGEIETIAHFKAAQNFVPDVEFILDIGGQDMKCLMVKNGAIEGIMLNEACSAGCGSFIQTLAKSLNIDINNFANMAINAKNPVELGSRCTVFMNSKVKQAQKEGATIADISAGIAYSVIKNALYKVIKVKNLSDLGDKIMVQGGTFNNDAVLRCFELAIGKDVCRPDIAGLMGAYGASLLASERYNPSQKSTIITKEKLNTFGFETSINRCNKCGNNCMLTENLFSSGANYISGNRCENGSGKTLINDSAPNLFSYKYNRLFEYKPLELTNAKRGAIGIPRVLNIYDNYPLWFTFLTELGFRVVISSRSSKKLFEKGIETIPSDTVCYPGKLVHGHIMDLVAKGVGVIFYPCLPKDVREDDDADNHFNCPIVASYPEVINNNMDILKEHKIKFMHPFLPIYNLKKLKERLFGEFKYFDISMKEIDSAITKAFLEFENFKNDIRKKGEETLALIKAKDIRGIVLAGRPYHIDPEINHGIPEMMAEYGMAIFTEDSVCHLQKVQRPIRVFDQWVYHTRLLNASAMVREYENMELVQLNSFGCGLDAILSDQVEEIIKSVGKIYTSIKIDDIDNLGAARIRIRSLKAAMNDRTMNNYICQRKEYLFNKLEFTKEMKKMHKILIPQFSPMHFDLIEKALNYGGYDVELLPEVTKDDIEVGLRFVNNDSCYPSVIVVGQLINALLSGKYDLSKTSVMISQTGGGCRATNYIALLRKALIDSGLSEIPVISFNLAGLDKQPGFNLTLSMFKRLIMAVLYGDVLSMAVYRVRPYEKIKGSTDLLYKVWLNKCLESITLGRFRDFKENVRGIIGDFDFLRVNESIKKPKVGVVGEILVKFHTQANNNLIKILESEGAEPVVPGLVEFILYAANDSIIGHKTLGNSRKKAIIGKIVIAYIERYRKIINEAAKKSKRFTQRKTISEMANKASEILSLNNNTGEGWLLTAEMIELIEDGVENIVCTQPFACLPSHITGKGMLKELKRRYGNANITAIDYDPGASEVNQLNRIKLMISNAFDKLNKKSKSDNLKRSSV